MAVAPKQKGLEILRKLVPLNTLAEGDLQSLLDKIAFEKLKKGEILFREGDTDNQNVYLLSGKVALLSGQREVDAVAAGSDTAKFPLAHQIPRKFSVVARSRAEVVRVDNRLLGELIARVGRSSYEVSGLDTEATDDWMSQLLQLRVFQQIPPENIQRVIMGMEEIYLNQGDLVVQQGEHGKYLYLINTGYCSVACEKKEGGKPEEVARLGPGDTFGEEALLSDAPRACTVSMLTDGLLLTLKKKDFLQYVKEPISRELDYPKALSEVEKGSLWLDVRPSEVFEENHLPDSINLPLSSLRYQLSSLDSERSYIVYCDDGRQSGTAAYLLYEQGFHVSVLTGGVKSIEVKMPRQGESGADIIRLQLDQETDTQEQPGPQEETDTQEQPEPQGETEPREETAGNIATSEIEKLQRRLIKTERQSEDQIKRSSQLKQALDKVKGQLSHVEEKRTEIEEKYHRLQGDAGQLRELLEQKEGELVELQDQATQVEVLSTDKAVAESRLRELESEVSMLMQKVEKTEQREQKTETRLVEAGARYDEQTKHAAAKEEGLQKELAAADDKVNALHLKLTTLENSSNEQSEQHRRERAALQEAIEQQKTAQTEVAQQFAIVQREKEQADQELTAMREQLAALESKLSGQESAGNTQAEQHRQVVTDLQGMIEQQKRDQAEAAEKFAILQREKEQADQELTVTREQLAALESKLSGQESVGNTQAEQHRQALTALQGTIDLQQTEQAETAQLLVSLRREKEQADQELTAVREQLAELESKLSARESSGNEQAEQNRQALTALQGTVEEQQAAQVEATAQLEKLRREKEQVDHELMSTREQLVQLESKLTAQESARDEQDAGLQQILTDLRLEKDRQGQELDNAKRQVGVLNESLAAMESNGSEQENRYRKELESLEQALDEQRVNAEKQLEAVRANQRATEAELARTREKQCFLQNELDALAGGDTQQGAKLQQEVDGLREELEKTRHQLSVSEEKVDTLGPESGRLLQELENTTNELVTVKGVIGEKDVQVGEQLQELARVNEKLEAQKQSSEEEISSLRQELRELADARDAVDEEMKRQRGQLEALKSGGGDIKALQAELETLTDALEESDKVYDEVVKRAEQAQAERDQQVARVVQLEDELKSLRQSAPGSGSGAEVEETRREKEEAESQLEVLKKELSSLHARIEQQAEDVRVAQAKTGDEEAALRSELLLVREQAESEVERLRRELEQSNDRLSAETESESRKEGNADQLKELEELRMEIKEKELRGAAETAENDALRKELAELQAHLAGHKQELNESSHEHNRLFEEVEGRNSEIDRLKQALDIATVEAEEADFRREEAEAARKQVEEALYEAQQDLETQRNRELVKGEIHASSNSLQITERTTERAGRKVLMGAVAGALLAFGVADGLSIMGGKGEIVSSLLGEEWLQQLIQRSRGLMSPDDTPNSPEAGGVDDIKTESVKPDVEVVGEGRKAAKAVAIPKATPVSAVQTSTSSRPDSQSPKPESSGAHHASAAATLRDRLTNGDLGPAMVYIHGGRFTMGGELTPLAQDEQPAHPVVLKSFAIGRFEVTFDEYLEFAMATGRDAPGDEGWGRGRRPVINVSWEDAVAYTEWLSEQTGRPYRLPTEAEWEYAATGGADTYYWWGYKLGKGRANCFNCDSQWDGASSAPVGSFEANAYGLHNTAGNVMEWVEDCYYGNYVGAPADGSALADADCRDRVVRGGAFNKPGDALRATRRSRQDAQARLSALGFRVVREVN